MNLYPLIRAIIGFVFLSSSFNSVSFADSGNEQNQNCLIPGDLATEGSEFIISSLKRVYHGGNRPIHELKNLLCLNDEQLDRAKLRLRDLEEDEAENALLNSRYQDPFLKLMALRDSDGDGILDFRIKEYGAFIQNDNDADEDDIINLMDYRPLSAGHERDKVENNDADGDGLPNHLDWSNENRFDFVASEKHSLIDIQAQIFKKHGIVLVQSEGSNFKESIADMTLDVLNLFSKMLKKHKVKERGTIRSITVASQYDVDPLAVLAEVSPVNGQAIIYEYGIKAMDNDPRKLIAPFMVYVHEFAHIIQNAMDRPHNLPDLLKSNTHTRPEKFIKAVKKLGWDMDPDDTVETEPSTLFVDHASETIPIKAKYNNQDINFKTLWEQCEDNAFNRENDMVGCYSLSSIREWHAEYITNTVLRSMYERLRETHSETADALINKAQCEMKLDWGGAFYDYNNANPKSYKKLRKQLGISGLFTNKNKLLDHLNQKYIVMPFLTSEISSDCH